MNPLWWLVTTRLREFVREPAALFWTFAFPVLLAAGLGLAFGDGAVRPPLPVAVLPGPARVERLEALARVPGIAARPAGEQATLDLFRAGGAVLAVSGGVRLEYWFDPAWPEAVEARRQVDDALQRAAGRRDPLAAADLAVTAPGTRYMEFLLPGLLGMNILSSSLWGIGWAVAQARRQRLLKRLAATPMRRSHYLLSLVLARLVFLAAEALLLVLLARYAFGIPLLGSPLALAGVCVLGAMSFAGLGLLIASRSENGEVVSGLINLASLPMLVMSGVFFSPARFPEWLQPVIQALPLTALNDALRACFQGAGPAAWLLPSAILAIWGAVSFGLALRLFRWV